MKQAVWNTQIFVIENMLSNVSIEDFWDIHQHMPHLIESLALPSMNVINVFSGSFITREEQLHEWSNKLESL